MNAPRLLLGAIALGLTMASASTAPAAGPSDSDISMWVRSALQHDHHVDPAGLEITTSGGVVTLDGMVLNLATQERALDDARKIDGVVGIVDKIRVSAPWRPDADITLDIRKRIVHNQMVESRQIGVVTVDGMVTLTGVVGSWAESQEIGILAAEVRGVHGVENRITVEYVGSRSDSEIKKDARSKLDLDVYMAGLPITVDVLDGVVTLTGTVGSLFEKDRAGREVRYLSHVKRVDNQLRVARIENRGVRTATTMSMSDKELASRVTSVIRMDSRITSPKVEVRAALGHVTLTGSVPYAYQKRMAEQDARNTIGTAWLTNELLVGGVRREDAPIRSDILAHFDSDYLLSGMDVTARVKEGTVTLGGYVNNKAQRTHAEEVVTRIIGVTKIKNHITVARDPVSDMALTRDVRNRLSRNWLTSNVQSYIGVTASDGAVTLTGEVNTWSERAEAARVALRTTGVWTVHNKLSVRGAAYPWDEWDDEVVYFSPYYWVWYR